MSGTKKDLELEIKLLNKTVDKLQNRCDDAVIAAKQAENLVKQTLEIVQKMQLQFNEKDDWDDATPEVSGKQETYSDVGSEFESILGRPPVQQVKQEQKN